MIIFSHFAKIFFSEKTDFKKDDLINCLNKIKLMTLLLKKNYYLSKTTANEIN